MIEEDTVGCKKPVSLSVILNHPIRVELRDGVGRARPEGSALVLGSGRVSK